MQPAVERPGVPVLVVAEAGRPPTRESSQNDLDGPHYRVVALQADAVPPRNVAALVGLSTVLFAFLAAMAFGLVGGLVVAGTGALGHAVGRFIHVRRRCLLAPTVRE